MRIVLLLILAFALCAVSLIALFICDSLFQFLAASQYQFLCPQPVILYFCLLRQAS